MGKRSGAGGERSGDERLLRPKSSAAEEYHETVFLSRYDEYLRSVEAIVLSVMVLGPKPGVGPIGEKRVDILNALRGRGHDAFFPEEEDDEAAQRDPLNLQELLLARSADAVILLRASHGAVAELSEFARLPEIMAKTLCFVDEEDADSYSSRGVVEELRRRSFNIRTYVSPDDVDQCRLLDETLEYVRLLQYARFRQSMERDG